MPSETEVAQQQETAVAQSAIALASIVDSLKVVSAYIGQGGFVDPIMLEKLQQVRAILDSIKV